jgi:phage-related baseplate assembly protein
MTTQIDLSQLPAPEVLEQISYEQIVADIKAAVIEIMPEMAPVLAIPTEPAVKIIEVCAYFVMLTRARVNDAARAVMLAYATGADLEHLAALYGVQRLAVTPANPNASPPVAAVMETDAALRARVQLAPEGFTVAGPRGAYLFHALSADGDVLDAAVASPAPGDVLVTVLSRSGNGAASPALLAAVSGALNAEDVRPLCDNVSVQAATIISYAVNAQLEFFDGPDPSVILSAAQAALQAYVDECRKIGRPVRISGIHAAVHRPGVSRVTLVSPVADIVPTATQSAFCTSRSVTAA